jgi:hypothetical protein
VEEKYQLCKFHSQKKFANKLMLRSYQKRDMFLNVGVMASKGDRGHDLPEALSVEAN